MAKNIQVKPGKAGSVLGLIVGCIFVGIGLFVVIPTFGRWAPAPLPWSMESMYFHRRGSPPTRLWWRMTSPKGMLRSIPQRRGFAGWRICTKRDWSLGRSTTNPASGFWRSYKKYQRGFPRFPPPAVEKGREMELPLDETNETPGGQHQCCPPGVSLVCAPVL